MTTKEEPNTKTAIEYIQHIVDGRGENGKVSFDRAFALVSEVDRNSVEELLSTFSMEVVDTTAQDDRVIVEAASSAAASSPSGFHPASSALICSQSVPSGGKYIDPSWATCPPEIVPVRKWLFSPISLLDEKNYGHLFTFGKKLPSFLDRH
ncbi:MAG: hypothetical protein JRD68_16800 [Deltaproteobacteria bacterium]|nr:hypothetical protein [Deltaproteobacteria bacterium]